MNTLAVSSWSLSRHLPRERYIPAAQALRIEAFPVVARERFGVSAVEICQMHLESPNYSYLDKVNRGLAAGAVRVLNVPIDIGDISHPDPVARARDIETIKQWIKAAAYLGSPAVRVNSGVSATAAALPVTIQSYRALVSFGKGLNVRVLLENHGGMSNDPSVIARIIDGVNSFYYFRLSPDFGNWDPVIRHDGLRMMMPHAYIVHVKTYDFDEQGEQHQFDFAECMRIVRDADFQGPLSIEFEGDGDQFEGTSRSLDLVKRYLAGAVAASAR